ncbi:interferon-induced protein with tetratricopeptide repeats 1-like [Apostichopus japonicus]|uniref:interferon-induced protein with tetratricopeptide repeats 1-like n=1 Tax=Stichopus japonicus TaxID=307972 RepID=UPI003AB2F966
MNSVSDNVEWWKKVPCHFTWSLEDTNEDYKSLKIRVEYKLESWKEEHSSPPCQPLLFLGFLEVSKFKGLPRQNPVQAMNHFSNVVREAAEMTVEDERNAFLTVALANRIWSYEILSQSQEGKENEDALQKSKDKTKNDEDLKRLKQLWSEKNELFEAYIEGIAVFALGRLGPKNYKKAEERCRKALEVIPTNPEWHYSLGCFIGRQIRCNLVSSRGGYNHIDDEVKCYEEALRLDPNFDLARCTLAQTLVKIPERKEESFKQIEKVNENTCAMVVKKGRFYRYQKDYKKALEILKKGVSGFERPRGELFFQIGLIYGTFAYQAGFERKFDEKNEYLQKQLEYSNKCLELEPHHHVAMLRKAQALGYLRRNDEAEKCFRNAIDEVEGTPSNSVEVKFWFAEHLTSRNRKQVTAKAAELYKDVMSIASSILENADDDALDDVKTGMRKFVIKSKSKLDEFHRGNQSKMEDVERMFANFHF